MSRMMMVALSWCLSCTLTACKSQPEKGAEAEAVASEVSDEAAPAPSGEPAVEDAAAPEGLVVYESQGSVDETFSRLVAAIEAKAPLKIMARVEHDANAAAAGLELPPTRLVIFGNPKAGTPLMQTSPTAAIDLPQKMIVYQSQGKTFVAHNDVAWLFERHGIEGKEQLAAKMSGLLAGLARAAASAPAAE